MTTPKQQNQQLEQAIRAAEADLSAALDARARSEGAQPDVIEHLDLRVDHARALVARLRQQLADAVS
jgi:hypothetical protein